MVFLIETAEIKPESKELKSPAFKAQRSIHIGVKFCINERENREKNHGNAHAKMCVFFTRTLSARNVSEGFMNIIFITLPNF